MQIKCFFNRWATKYQGSGKIQPDSKMGYISNVKDARKKLEADYNLKEDSKES